ncbi:endo-1,4-beta-xylanase 5-like isoform X1 [Hevea brasiliensis]|uniref:endo-1,4-beta-xylanase 5-like isoform X1 n=1 Tax=Hevea brasiliensis TaxID=3981 RepID=UPI0025FA4109|nr:endo-1,4-beta-xylanase 5-like isoform X1 [Hevea brasiliensis]
MAFLSKNCMQQASSFLRFLVFLLLCPCFALSYDGPSYDYTAYTECKEVPERPLYNGGILQNELPAFKLSRINDASITYKSPAFVLPNLTQDTIYCFSTWVKIQGAESSLVTASLTTDNATYNCVGTVLAQSGCWSFLKGGFILDAPSNLSTLYFQARKRAVTIHVSDSHGNRLQEAAITIEQISKDFPLGSAIASTILGNLPYQDWFVERFNAAVFENELKWYATEPEQGEVDYSIPDQMLQLIRANQIVARGHNIFWEDPTYTPAWVRNLSGAALKSAVNSRIQSLMSKYKEEFIHWDVSNEMLHFDFYEQRLGPDATLYFYETAHIADPSATLFMNEFNVVETCSDVNSTVDTYISRLRDLERGGIFMDGIGLESHFSVPNLPLMRGVLDKLATLGLPIWLTEVDISSNFDYKTQAFYLEQVLREGYSHPAVNGIILWTALHPDGCYQMCLTDNNLQNLPAGDVVDKLLLEWKTGELNGYTDEHGSYSLHGYLGEYRVSVAYGNRAANSTFSLCPSDETKHFNIQL